MNTTYVDFLLTLIIAVSTTVSAVNLIILNREVKERNKKAK